MFLTAVGQCRLLDTVPLCCQKKWASLLGVPPHVTLGGARDFNTTILTVGTRDVQGAVRSPVLLHLRSRPPGLADSQHRVSVTNSLSFSLDWCHSVMAQKSSLFFFFTLMEHKLWQQKRWANCNYATIWNVFCILQQFWGKWRVYLEISLQRWQKKWGEESWNTLWSLLVQRLTAGTGQWICLLTQLPVTCDWGEPWKTLIL